MFAKLRLTLLIAILTTNVACGNTVDVAKLLKELHAWVKNYNKPLTDIEAANPQNGEIPSNAQKRIIAQAKTKLANI